MGVIEVSTTPEEGMDKRQIAIMISEKMYEEARISNEPAANTNRDTDMCSGTKKHRNMKQRQDRQGYSGLVNQGATCYLNAVLQTLFMTEEFRKAIMKINESEMKSVSIGLKNVFSCLESNNGSATTNEVTYALGIRNVCEQQDASEYYQMILSMTEPEPAKVFQGNKKHLTTCIHGNHDPSVEIISFYSLPIAMDSGQKIIDVEKSFEAQFEVMLMDGEDQLYCENCKSMMDMEVRCIISELPDILTLHLQRFYLDYSYMIYRKNNSRVKIPLQLSAQEERDVYEYELYAVINHVGSLSSGHYYADIKSFKGQQWYRFNDSMVNSIPQKRDAKRYFISDKAFMLFFRKSSKQATHEVNVQRERAVSRSDESEGLQTKRTTNPEDSVSLPKQETNRFSTDTENSHESTVSSEKNLQAPENESDHPQTITTDVDMQSADPDHDAGATPDISSNAQVNIPSATSEIISDNSLQVATVKKTHDIGQIMVQQPEEDNHPSPAGIRASKQATHEVNVQRERAVSRSDESEGLQTKRTTNPEDSVSLPKQETNRFSTDTENSHESTVSSEKNLQAPENESDHPQTITTDVDMQSADPGHDARATPDISSNAQVNIPSATSEIISDNSLQVATVKKTHDIGQIMVQQPEEDNHPSPAGIRASKQATHEVNVQRERAVSRSDESEGLQTKRTTNPEDSVSLPKQETNRFSTDTENSHESTVSSEKNLQAPENESDHPQTITTDVDMQSADPDHDARATPDISSNAQVNIPSATSEIISDNSLQVATVKKTHDIGQIMVLQPEEDNHPSPAGIRDSEITGTTGPQQDRDHLCADNENATDANYDQPTLNLNLTGGCVIFTKERQRRDPEPHVTTHNESDSDNDDPEAQCSSLLEQTNVRRRKIKRWMFLLLVLFLCVFILGFILVFVLIEAF